MKRIETSDLAKSISAMLKTKIRDQSIRWPYHPRANKFGGWVAGRCLEDLTHTSKQLFRDLDNGDLACSRDSKLSLKNGPAKKIDVVIGVPQKSTDFAPGEVMIAPVLRPRIAIEVKACMTEHGKVLTRLSGEIHSSSQVMNASPNCISCLVFVVNSSKAFTSPMNLPGPNTHEQPHDAQRISDLVVEYVRSGHLFDAACVVAIEFDNESIARVSKGISIPKEFHYDMFLKKVASQYRRRFGSRS